LKNTEGAEDAVHDVFLKYSDTIKQFDGKCNIKTWLLTLTRNHCFNIIKSKGYIHSDLDEVDSMNSFSPDMELHLSLESALMKLSASQNELLYLKDAAGYSYIEIGELTGLTPENVKIKLFRIRTILRCYLKDEL
jgi:RNA polymerase sigma-70 factor (ECF subfamily)